MTDENLTAFITAIDSIADQLRSLGEHEKDLLFASARETLDDREDADILTHAILSGVRLGHRSAGSIGRELPI